MARRRRNPMPLTGALFVRNPRHRRFRRNSLAVRENMTNWMKQQYHAWKKKEGLSVRGAFRVGQRKEFFDYIAGAKGARQAEHAARKAKRAAAKAKRGGLTLAEARKQARDFPKMTRKSAKGANRAVKKGKKVSKPRTAAQLAATEKMIAANKASRGKKAAANPRFRYRRNWGGLAVQNPRRNQGGYSLAAVPGAATVQGFVGRVPLVGGALATALPVAVLALGGAYVNAKFVSPYVGRYLPKQMSMLAGTLTGSAVAIAAKLGGRFLPARVQGIVDTIAAASVLAGVLGDAVKFAGTKGLPGFGDIDGFGDDDGFGDIEGLGDGMAYQIAGLGAEELGAVVAAYNDAEMADAYYSGPDFDAIEGEAALSGVYGWFGAFGRPAKRAAGQKRQTSSHAGKQGHRWGWLVKLVGFENMQKIAALEPQRRLEVLKSLREQAVASLPNLMAQAPLQQAVAQMQPGATGADLSGLGYGDAVGMGYGALLYAGG